MREIKPHKTTDTKYFVDPSIATAAMGLGPNELMKDLNTLWLFFETMCVCDLRVYADAINGKVYHYRDGNLLECNSVLHLRNGHYGLIEIAGRRGLDRRWSRQSQPTCRKD